MGGRSEDAAAHTRDVQKNPYNACVRPRSKGGGKRVCSDQVVETWREKRWVMWVSHPRCK